MRAGLVSYRKIENESFDVLLVKADGFFFVRQLREAEGRLLFVDRANGKWLLRCPTPSVRLSGTLSPLLLFDAIAIEGLDVQPVIIDENTYALTLSMKSTMMPFSGMRYVLELKSLDSSVENT
jgi:hypothetical protein